MDVSTGSIEVEMPIQQELIEADDKYPSEALLNISNTMETEDELTVEYPRGYYDFQTDSIIEQIRCMDIVRLEEDGEIKQSSEVETEEPLCNEAAKLRKTLVRLKADSEWARSLASIRMTANKSIDKVLQFDTIYHCFKEYNSRPRYTDFLTKDFTIVELTDVIKLAFSSKEEPLQRSAVHLYAKNPVSGLKELMKAIHRLCDSIGLCVEYNDIFAVFDTPRGSVRLKTDRVNDFLRMKIEERGQEMGMRFLTTLLCKKEGYEHVEMTVHYFTKKGCRYVRMICTVYDSQTRVTFGGPLQSVQFEVEQEMVPLPQPYAPPEDIIDFFQRYSSQNQQNVT